MKRMGNLSGEEQGLYMDIGIIGGADGPTSIYVSSDTNLYTIIAVVILCILVLGVIIRMNNKRKN